MLSENRAGSCMLFEYDCFSTCAPQYLVPAGHYFKTVSALHTTFICSNSYSASGSGMKR